MIYDVDTTNYYFLNLSVCFMSLYHSNVLLSYLSVLFLSFLYLAVFLSFFYLSFSHSVLFLSKFRHSLLFSSFFFLSVSFKSFRLITHHLFFLGIELLFFGPRPVVVYCSWPFILLFFHLFCFYVGRTQAMAW